jgi:hypothetical protein
MKLGANKYDISCRYRPFHSEPFHEIQGFLLREIQHSSRCPSSCISNRFVDEL